MNYIKILTAMLLALIICAFCLASCKEKHPDYTYNTNGFETRADLTPETKPTEDTGAETKRPGSGAIQFGESGLVQGTKAPEQTLADGETRDPDDTAYLIDTETGWITGWW